MSAAQTQKETLEALGLSQKELVLAEALQMEYDALSRLKQDKSGTETSQTGPRAPSQTRSKSHNPSLPPRPTPSQTSPALTGGNLLRGLSGSDSSLNQPGRSQSPPSVPARALPPQGGYIKESLYILDSPEVSKFRDCSGSSLRDSTAFGSGFLPKGFPSFPDDVPPALPPRNPIPPSSGSENPFLPPRGSTVPRDVNLFTPDVDQPKVTSGELNYDNINDSLSRLNEGRQGPRGRRANGDQSGKPVARSKTLPPQVPPRTYVPVPKSNKNQRRVSADPVRMRLLWGVDHCDQGLLVTEAAFKKTHGSGPINKDLTFKHFQSTAPPPSGGRPTDAQRPQKRHKCFRMKPLHSEFPVFCGNFLNVNTG